MLNNLTHLSNLTPFRHDEVVIAIAAKQSSARLEIAAVKFAGEQIIGDWSTARLGFDLPDLPAFCREAPVVGFGLADVLGTLALQGVAPSGPPWDLGELAALVAPARPRGSLAELARSLLGEGIDIDGPSASAGAAQRAFLALTRAAAALRSATLQRLAQLAAWSHSPLASLIASCIPAGGGGPLGAGAIDAKAAAERLERPRSLGMPKPLTGVTAEEVSGLLTSSGLFARFFPRYEPRLEQVAMTSAVARAFGPHEDDGPRQLIVEGGTGIGKSVAYLLPAILFAVRNNVRVVISTNTINLQEQLVTKDIPNLLRVLQAAPGVDVSQFRYAVMKGKANYLCLRRWQALNASDAISPEEASLLSKTLAWIDETSTGDRTELGLRGRDASLWERISASGFSSCPGAREGSCFYRNVRDTAGGAHLVVVNHALLLSDLQVDGSILPEYDYLIIDEAHNLEAEATQQFGFRVSPATIDDLIERVIATTRGLAQAVRASALGEDRKQAVQAAADDAQLAAYHMRDTAGELAVRLTAILHDGDVPGRAAANDARDLWITPAVRAQPSWSTLDVAWDNFERSTADVTSRAEAAWTQTESLSADAVPGLEVVRGDLAEWLTDQREVRSRVASFVSKPDDSMVYWLTEGVQGITMNAAPLAVGPRLWDELFATKQTTVLTSATMTSANSFAHVRERLGLEDADELALGSPFDYRRAALLAVPTDVPEPNLPHYVPELGRIIGTLAAQASGHTLALFTSHAALRHTANLLRDANLGLPILTQGIDGNPQQLLRRFQADPESILLGTSSFWEGVDVAEGALKVLVVTRLPFNVPTEPVFAARSALYERPFFEYAMPQAVLRFRQGFGRLIRNKDDFGAVVVLDSRVHTKSYGRIFIASLPPATVAKGPTQQVLAQVSAWLERP